MNRRTAIAGIGSIAATVGAGRVRAADATLHLAAPPTDASAEYFYADAQGFFRRAGLSCDISHLANGEAVTAGVLGGSIDVGVGQAISLITAHSRGLPITILAGSAVNSTTSESGGFFVPNNSTAKSGKDLNGKTVGVQGLRGFAQYGTQAWLDKTGGDSSTVHFVEMTSSVMAKALADGRLDGAFIPEPFVYEVSKAARKIATSMDAVAPRFLAGAHFTTVAWANAHADVVRRFLNVIYETAAWANRNHDRTAEILSTASGLDIDLVRHAQRVQYVERRDPALLQPMINLAAKYAGITPFPAEDLFYKG